MENVRKIKTFVDIISCILSILYFLTRLKCKLNDIAIIEHGNEQILEVRMCSGVVARRYQEVGKDTELVLCQLLFVLGPVILVGSLEVLEDILDGGRDGLGVVEMLGQDHQDVREVGRDVVRAGVDEGTETQDGRMPADQGC